MTESANMADFGKPEIQATGESKVAYMSPSGMPLLRHGDLKMSQSGAIENYIAAIAPKYSAMTVQQRAVDQMYGSIKEEILLNCAKAVFTTRKIDEAKARDDVAALFDKWFALFEQKVPEDGFIQGLGFPTPADLALLNIKIGYMPFGAARKMVGYDFGKWPKVMALCDRPAADPAVASYLASSTYTAANPMNL